MTRRILALSLSLAVAGLATPATADKGALVLKEQGSFYAGGEIIEIPARDSTGEPLQPGDISINHVYVQYQIPAKKKYLYPIIMVHGGGHTGKTYETTPDGREGWYTSFTRRGFASYAIDDPNRGRACCEPTEYNLVRPGLLDPSELPRVNIYTKQQAYATFRFGPEYPTAYPGVRFPLDDIDQYAPQWVFTYRDAEENDKITNGIIAAIDAVGPCIVMTHSQSGPRGLAAVLARTDKVKAYISIEPAGFGIPAGESAATLVDVPILTMFGDYVELSGGATSWLNSASDTAQQVNAAGGNATVYVLPDHGIEGNSHMMMMDNNSEELADIIEDWIRDNVN